MEIQIEEEEVVKEEEDHKEVRGDIDHLEVEILEVIDHQESRENKIIKNY